MGIRLSRALAAGCGAVALAAGGAAHADSSELDWMGVVYLWGASIGVDARDRSIDASFSDIIDKLDMGFMGRVEAQGDDIGGFVDVVYMSVSDGRTTGPVSARGELDMSLMDLALVWSPGAERFTGTEVFGGIRYLGTDFNLRATLPPPLPSIAGGIDKSYTDFLVGARYMAPINDSWRLSVKADLSAGDTEGTWSLAGFGVYQSGRHHFFVGYRHLEAEVAAGGSERVDMSFSGPAIGYGFGF